MEAFLQFFENLSTLQKIVWIFGSLAFTWLLEFGAPLVQLNYTNKWKHGLKNLAFLATSVIINTLFGILTVGIFIWLGKNNFGLLNWIDLNLWVELVIAVMALDFFAQWIAHYSLHKFSWLWKFHLVHHSDTAVDATTGTRLHPGDFLVREVFALLAIIAFGIPFGFYMFYRITTILITYFVHANIHLPLWLDKGISLILISPNMHKFHHHFERPWTDSNFGSIFSIWDRIFGTFVYDDPSKIIYGVDVIDESKSEDLAYQFRLPWDKSIKTDY